MTTNILGGEGTIHPMAAARSKNRPAQAVSLENIVKELTAEVHQQRGDIETLKNELAVVKSAVVKGEEYLEFLRHRRVARVAAKQQ